MPTTSVPTIVHVHWLDSRYANRSAAAGAARRADQASLAVNGLARLRAPESILVATQWGTPESRISYALGAGTDTPIFPTTPEEFIAAGFDWLVEPQGFSLVWDLAGEITALSATRRVIRGVEVPGNVRMLLCANNEGILGWARTQRQHWLTEVALGPFVDECARGELQGLSADYRLPAELLTQYDLADTWFALLLPDAYAQPVPVETTPAAAQAILDAATVPVPLKVVATNTLTADFQTYVSAEEHRAALADLGVAVDGPLSDALPAWVYGFATHPATTLVVFDDTGQAVGYFAASPSNPSQEGTLQQFLLLNGVL